MFVPCIIKSCNITYKSIIHTWLISCNHLRLSVSLLPLSLLLSITNDDLAFMVFSLQLHRTHTGIYSYRKMLDTLFHHPNITLIPPLQVHQLHGGEGSLFLLWMVDYTRGDAQWMCGRNKYVHRWKQRELCPQTYSAGMDSQRNGWESSTLLGDTWDIMMDLGKFPKDTDCKTGGGKRGWREGEGRIQCLLKGVIK